MGVRLSLPPLVRNDVKLLVSLSVLIMAISEITYFVNHYDKDGDLFEEGVFLSIRSSSFKVCDSVEELSDVISHLESIQKEIMENP